MHWSLSTHERYPLLWERHCSTLPMSGSGKLDVFLSSNVALSQLVARSVSNARCVIFAAFGTRIEATNA